MAASSVSPARTMPALSPSSMIPVPRFVGGPAPALDRVARRGVEVRARLLGGLFARGQRRAGPRRDPPAGRSRARPPRAPCGRPDRRSSRPAASSRSRRPGERGAELVRGVRDEGPLGFEHCIEPVRHLVELVGHLDLLARAALGCAGLGVAGGASACGLAERAQRPGDGAGEDPGDAEPENQGEQHRSRSGRARPGGPGSCTSSRLCSTSSAPIVRPLRTIGTAVESTSRPSWWRPWATFPPSACHRDRVVGPLRGARHRRRDQSSRSPCPARR